jgi:hypothetical protein
MKTNSLTSTNLAPFVAHFGDDAECPALSQHRATVMPQLHLVAALRPCKMSSFAEEEGFIMRLRSALKVVSLAAALAVLAGVPGASARVKHRYTRRPVDSCLFHRRVMASGTLCSLDCKPGTLGCSQQICSGGRWYAALPCPLPFCSQRCG